MLLHLLTVKGSLDRPLVYAYGEDASDGRVMLQAGVGNSCNVVRDAAGF
jgi:hypothetical protein